MLREIEEHAALQAIEAGEDLPVVSIQHPDEEADSLMHMEEAKVKEGEKKKGNKEQQMEKKQMEREKEKKRVMTR